MGVNKNPYILFFNSTAYEMSICINTNNTLRFKISNYSITSQLPIKTYNFYHLAWSISGKVWNIYLNGVLFISTTVTVQPPTTTYMTISSGSASYNYNYLGTSVFPPTAYNSFIGALFDFRFYITTLSQYDIKSLYMWTYTTPFGRSLPVANYVNFNSVTIPKSAENSFMFWLTFPGYASIYNSIMYLGSHNGSLDTGVLAFNIESVGTAIYNSSTIIIGYYVNMAIRITNSSTTPLKYYQLYNNIEFIIGKPYHFGILINYNNWSLYKDTVYITPSTSASGTIQTVDSPGGGTIWNGALPYNINDLASYYFKITNFRFNIMALDSNDIAYHYLTTKL